VPEIHAAICKVLAASATPADPYPLYAAICKVLAASATPADPYPHWYERRDPKPKQQEEQWRRYDSNVAGIRFCPDGTRFLPGVILPTEASLPVGWHRSSRPAVVAEREAKIADCAEQFNATGCELAAEWRLKHEEAMRVIDKLTLENEEAESARERAEQDVAAARKRIQDLSDANVDASQRIEDLSNDVADLQAQLGGADGVIYNLRDQRDQARNRLNRLRYELADLREELAAARSEIGRVKQIGEWESKALARERDALKAQLAAVCPVIDPQYS
jgi:DNA repair exonuclease SbcCD ATPase subunit